MDVSPQEARLIQLYRHAVPVYRKVVTELLELNQEQPPKECVIVDINTAKGAKNHENHRTVPH